MMSPRWFSHRLLLLSAGLLLALDAAAGRERPDLDEADRARVRTVTKPASVFDRAEPFEAMAGGAATALGKANAHAFSHPSANLDFAAEERFRLGNALFGKFWVAAPSSTQASDGLGPLYNARACQSCHLRDGRGHPPTEDGDATSLLLRLARPPQTQEERAAAADFSLMNFPDPVYGAQLQDYAVPGLASEGRVAVDYRDSAFRFADGSVVHLRKPTYAISQLNYGPLDATTTISPRIANPMIGLGLIEAIADSDLVALSDPQDSDGDGISGRLAMTRDRRSGTMAIGRFGWKAQNASVRDQAASAFAGDLGISTPDEPRPFGDCTPAQTACLALPAGIQPQLGESEAPAPVLDLVTFYAKNLAVPVRRDVAAPTVLAGKAAFYRAGCPDCHHPKFVTRRDAADPALAFQLIWPYSDFLLHDMGEGLADGQPVGVASGQEWRTPPLWGIGLTRRVSGEAFFLHDGRARNLTEAILWHGGEAARARDAFATMEAADRQALITFLESL